MNRLQPYDKNTESLVELNNGQLIKIYYTCWHSIKHIVKTVINTKFLSEKND